MMNPEKSTTTKLSSLRDILLKSSAINFDKIFLDADHVQGGAVLKKGIHLPPNLFEDIQLMGRQIRWPISARFLKPCLSSRDALNWANVDLLLGVYEIKDLLKVQEARLPIKQFSFRVNRVTQDLICLVRKLAPTLELLHVGFLREIKANLRQQLEFEDREAPLEFPKLIKLIIDFEVATMKEMIYIDFKTCRETLESIEFDNFFDYVPKTDEEEYELDFFFDSLKHLQKLKTLTLFRFKHKLKFLEAIKKLKSLRSIIIIHSHINFKKNNVIKLLDSFPNLEYFIICNSYHEIDIGVVKSKNLKYLGYHIPAIRKRYDYDVPGVEKLAQKVGSSFNADSLLTSFEHYTFATLFTPRPVDEIIIKLKIHGPNYLNIHQWQKIETVILIFIERFWTDWDFERFLYANYLIKLAERNNYRWTTDFMEKVANLTVNFAFYIQKDIELMCDNFVWYIELMKSRQILNFMLEHIKRNPNRKTSRMYFKFLLWSYTYYYTDIEKRELIDTSTDVQVSSLQYSEIVQNHADKLQASKNSERFDNKEL